MTPVRSLDHIAIAVASTEEALATFAAPLGLEVVHSEVQEDIGVRLTYVDCGNALIQFLEPVGDTNADLVRWVEETGGGLHHVCFGTDDVGDAADRLRNADGDVRIGSGRGRPSAFAPGLRAGVRIEFTAFDGRTDDQRAQ